MQLARRHQNEFVRTRSVNRNAFRRTSSMNVRRCIASGDVLDKSLLLRFVIGDDDAIVFDAAERLPGVSIWLSANRQVLEKATRGGLFAKVAKRPVDLPNDIVATVASLLKRKCLNTIGLARRARQCVGGFEKTRLAMEGGFAGILLVASDGSQSEKAKLLCRDPLPNVIDAFSASELGTAFGRTHIVYGAIQHGALADTLMRDANRLGGVEGHDFETNAQHQEKPATTQTEAR